MPRIMIIDDSGRIAGEVETSEPYWLEQVQKLREIALNTSRPKSQVDGEANPQGFKSAHNLVRDKSDFIGPASLSDDEIEEMFTYHPPNSPQQVQQYANVNHAAKNFVRAIRDNVPDSEDRRQSISFVRMARMMSNSSIANRGRF